MRYCYKSSEGRGKWGPQVMGGRRDPRGKEGNRGVTLAKKKVQMQIEVTEGEWVYVEWLWFWKRGGDID